MISDWPVVRDAWNFAEKEQEIETIKEAVRGVRNIRNTMNVAPSKKVPIVVSAKDKKTLDIFTSGQLFFQSLAGASSCTLAMEDGSEGDKMRGAVSVPLAGAVLYIPLAELVDIKAEIERLRGELKRLDGELARSDKMLSNEKFLAGAKPEKVAEEREKKEKYAQKHAQVAEQLARLEGLS